MNIIPLLVAVPLGFAFVFLLLKAISKKILDVLLIIMTSVLALLPLLLLSPVKTAGVLVYKVGGWAAPFGIAMVIDSLSLLMLLVVGVVSFFISLYATSYMEKFTDKAKFYSLFSLILAGMNGVILTGDLFNLFVFYEIAVIASYSLVAFGVEAEELEASFKYQVLSGLASLCILLGIAFVYAKTGTLNMADISLRISHYPLSRPILFASLLFITGFGLKAGLVPFHAWLPDAHPAAPAPVSAVLSGIFIKVVGVYALVRILFNIIGMTTIFLFLLLCLGVITIIIGGFMAIGQDDIKRMLAYSSTSQIGYIVVGLALSTPLGILGGIFHLVNHAVFKALLFLNSGSLEYATGRRKMSLLGQLRLRDKMPVTYLTSLAGSLSISGIPPFNGFISKLIIIIACIQAHRYVLALVCVLVSVITLAYYLRFQNLVFFGKAQKQQSQQIKEVPRIMCVAMIALALLCVLISAFYPLIKQHLLEPAASVLTSGLHYARGILESGL
jgi:multicomponent Na+:H+ antiporter subunit D